MAGWVLPTLAYVVMLGVMGVTIKLALRTIEWQQLVLWVPIAYACFAVGLVLFGGTRFPTGAGSAWAALTAFLASAGLIALFYALTKGAAGTVVPFSSAYPVVTVFASAAFLAERLTVERLVGTALVVAGVVVLSR